MGRRKKKVKNLAGQNAAPQAAPEVGRSARLWLAASLVLVGFFLYRPALRAPFVLDDVHKIQNNPDLRVERLSQVFSKLIYPYTQNKSFVRNDPSRPVTFLTFTLNYYFGKLDPYGYRVVDLLGHVGVGILLFLLSQRLFFLLFGTEQVVLSFFMALLFVVHPVNAIVALYTFNRSDILAALASLGAVLLFLGPAPLSRWRYGGSLALFVIGLGSKQSAAVLPAILLLADFVVAHHGKWESFRARVRLHIPFWIVLGLYFISRKLYFGSIGDLEAQSPLDSGTYMISQIHSVARYIQCVVFPMGLSFDHFPKNHTSLADPAILLSGLALSVLAVLAWIVVRRGTAVSRLVLFSVLWFVIQLAPTSSFLPTTTSFAENRLYLSQYGLLLLLALGYCAVFRVDLSKRFRLGAHVLSVGLLVVLLSFFGRLAYARGLLFSDPFKLWEDVLRVYPTQPRAYYSLGYMSFENKDYDKALAYYEKAVECNPKYAEALNNIGMIYTRRWETEKGIDYFQKSIDAQPREISYCNLGRAYTNLKKYPEALAALDHALALNPSSSLGHTLEGRLWFERKDFQKARWNYDQAALSNPDFFELQNNRGLLSMEDKKYDEAIDHFNRAVAAQPDYAEGYFNLSVAYAESGRPEKSQEFRDKAISLDPQYIFKPVRFGAGLMEGGAFQLPPDLEKYMHPAAPSAPR